MWYTHFYIYIRFEWIAVAAAVLFAFPLQRFYISKVVLSMMMVVAAAVAVMVLSFRKTLS